MEQFSLFTKTIVRQLKAVPYPIAARIPDLYKPEYKAAMEFILSFYTAYESQEIARLLLELEAAEKTPDSLSAKKVT